MRMPFPAPALCVILLAGTLAASGVAVYQRRRVQRLERDLAAAIAEAQKLRRPLKARRARTPAQESVKAAGAPSAPAGGTDAIHRAVPDPSDSALQLRIDGLESQATNAPAPQRPRRGRGWLADLKKNDPERYAGMMKRREEVRERSQRSLADKAAYFLKRDTSDMSEEEQVEYSLMLQLLEETWKLTARFGPDLPREERREAMRTLRENVEILDPMLQSEREREFYSLGLELGYDADESILFVQHLNDVIDLTSIRSVYGGMRPGMRRTTTPTP